MKKRWNVMLVLGLGIVLNGVMGYAGLMAQASTEPDYEEFKRYEAFRKSKIDAAEKEKQDGAKAVYDDFLLYKEYRAMSQKEGVKSPTPPTTPSAPPAPVAPSAVVSPVPVSGTPASVPASLPVPASAGLQGTLREDEFKEAYRRYKLMNTLDAVPTPVVSPVDRTLSLGWAWVFRFGPTVVDYQVDGRMDTFKGWEFGFGGRLVLPIGSNTAISLGPDFVGAGLKMGLDRYGNETQQQYATLRLPLMIHQRLGMVVIGVGGYVSHVLMADQMRLTAYNGTTKERFPYYLEPFYAGATVSVAIAVGDAQLGLAWDMPMSNVVEPRPNGRDSRMASYGLVLSTRM